jgi:N-acetylglucosaminyl-diphospho-decaprenol L-rhamnosyltransferase
MKDRKPVAEGETRSDIVLTIIISCYNTRELVCGCLNSLYQNPPEEPYEIILVDDASTDGTSQMVCETFPEVRLLRNKLNQHYSYSNNRGLDRARGEFVLLLNNDTIVRPLALGRMISFLRDHPEAGMVGCKLLNEDGTVQWSVKALPGPAAALFGARSIVSKLFPNNRFTRQHLLHIDRDMTQPFVAGFVSGAGSMMPLAIFKKIGRLDGQFFYHVDADYCKRIAEAGYKCYYLPTASIVHLNHKGGTTASLSRRFQSLIKFELDSFRYYRKHMQRSPWSLMQIVAALGLSFHFLVFASAQAFMELAAAIRPRSRASMSIGARMTTEEDAAYERSFTGEVASAVSIGVRRGSKVGPQSGVDRESTSTDGNRTDSTIVSPVVSQEWTTSGPKTT